MYGGTMKLYEKYNLPVDVDFINVELTTDNEYWIDPMMMYMDKSLMGKKCCEIVQQYFSVLLELAMCNDTINGYLYTKDFIEMNETRLGYSKNEPKGSSGGEALGKEIFDLIINSKAVKTELIGDIFDASVMIGKLGIDKMSDFITSLIFEELIDYTQSECRRYNITMKKININKMYWSYQKQDWVKGNDINLPYDEESKMAIVFIPKKFTESKLVYSYSRFYGKGMIPYLGRSAVDNRLEGLIRILKDGTIKPFYKNIRKQYPCTRKNVNDFINNHNEVYDEYKRKQMTYVNYKTYKNRW